MTPTEVHLMIPCEIIDLKLEVEMFDSIRPILDEMEEIPDSCDALPSIHRLRALCRVTEDVSGIKKPIHTRVLRDLWQGKFWKLGERASSLD